jgi:hypothetical protein
MEDQIDDLYEAMEQSRRSAERDLVEDAMIELTGLQGKPATRLRLLAVIALDDIQAHCVNADERERMEITKQALKEFIYSAIPLGRDPIYEAAYSYVEDAEPAQLTVYRQLFPIHEHMVEEEEVAAAVEWASIQEQLEAQAKAEAEAKVAEAKAQEEKERLNPTDPAARRALFLEALAKRNAERKAE